MLQRMVQSRILLLMVSLALIPGEEWTVLFFTTWHRTDHPWNTQDLHRQAQQSKQYKVPVVEPRREELQRVRQCLKSVGITPHKRGSGARPTNLPKWKVHHSLCR